MLGLVLRVVASLCIVLGLLWLTARIGSRRLGGGSRTLLRVRGRQPLSRTSSVAVVEVGNRLLVVGVGEAGVRLLTELDPDDLPAADPGPAAGLTELHRGIGLDRRVGLDRRDAAAPASVLGGSLLTPQTWKQAWAAATRRTIDAPDPVDAALVDTTNGDGRD